MKVELIIILGLATISLALFSTYFSNIQESEFQNFMETYSVNYKDTTEYEFRLKAFKANLDKIQELADRNPLARFGVNKFADRTPEEFESMLNYRRSENYKDPCIITKMNRSTNPVTLEDIPKNVDWRSLMGEIQDQGKCGGCWAFSTAAVTEGRYALSKGLDTVQTRFSPQQLIDCNTKNLGCRGGLEALAFDWLQSNDFCFAEDYPYKAKKSKCQKECTTGVEVKTCTKISVNDNEQAVIELQNGPVDVAIDSTQVMLYEGGIMTSCIYSGLNHAVTLVGYNSDDNGQATVTFRNSWGGDWGEEGHFRLAYEDHLCGWDEDAHTITV
eukprot:CAMPEP_0205822256 /NCGR_PEP_ID=MMETSP0206-20130828/11786_1 /ASSEMBLY_ACC=CAM_ASM_000279 /TAXON_ID=36767 /ORGANISM="Euplotes focardii, Strain TN1" /LENGTH=328 /DNA_ID=CAMNT_0053118383 /DNA_START=1 /DNA_END=987 /DNA_ORIENTATION=+